MTRTRILRLKINGHEREVAAEPNAILLDVLREGLGLTGTKRGCDMGTCGCCNVLLDGRPVNSCLVLAWDCEDREITTIEGLLPEDPGALHPLQEAWAETGGSQCGFCSPGFIVTAEALLREDPEPTETRVREALSGNLCRCTGYKKIVEAVLKAARSGRGVEVGS